MAEAVARSHDHFHEESRSEASMRAWLERWVLGVPDWVGFLDRLGRERLAVLRIAIPRPSPPLDYGA
jgi:hypothetical protein